MYERRCHQDAWILGRAQNRGDAKNGKEEADSWKFIWRPDSPVIGNHDDADIYGWLIIPRIWNWRRRIQ